MGVLKSVVWKLILPLCGSLLNFSVSKLFSVFSSLWTYMSLCLQTGSKNNIKTRPSPPESGDLVLALLLSPKFYGLGHNVSHRTTAILTSSTCLGTDYSVHAHHVHTHPQYWCNSFVCFPPFHGKRHGKSRDHIPRVLLYFTAAIWHPKSKESRRDSSGEGRDISFHKIS